MALADIMAAIRADADAELARVAATCDHACLAIAEEAEHEAKAVTQAIVARATRQANTEAQAIERAARRELTMTRLRARDDMLASLLQQLAERLHRQRETPAYPALLARLIMEAIAELPAARVAHVDERDAAAARAILTGIDITVVADLHTAGGVVLDDGRGARVIHTLEARVDALEDGLRRVAVRLHPALAGERSGVVDGS